MSDSLDLKPIPAPVNPFAWAAGQLRSAVYRTVQERDQAREISLWLSQLAARTTGMESNEPLIIAACARLAVSGDARALIRRACDATDELLRLAEQQKAPTNGHAPTTGAALQGFTIE